MINILNGVKDYVIPGMNGEYTLRINPTDDYFAESLNNLLEECDKVEECYSERVKAEENGTKLWEISKERNNKLRLLVDETLGNGFCDTVYGNISLHAGDGDGLPLWLSLIFSIFDEMSAEIDRENAATQARLNKYVSKYKKKK